MHEIGPKTYLLVLLALMALLGVTVGLAFLDLDRFAHGTALALAMTVAIVKGLLIVLYFMHVRYASRMTWAFAGAGFLWLGILVALTLSDYLTRNHPADLNYRGEPRYLLSEPASTPR